MCKRFDIAGTYTPGGSAAGLPSVSGTTSTTITTTGSPGGGMDLG